MICKFKSCFLFLIIILPLPQFFGQVTFQKIYPTSYDKTSREVLVTSDGGYIIAGSTNNNDILDCDIYVIKTNSIGDTIWTKSYGGPKPDYAYSMLETNDGNFFILGFSQSFGGGDYDTYLIKISPAGNLLWQKTYGGSGNEHGREIVKTSDGNYVMVGCSDSFSASKDIFLTKIDGAGIVIWSKYYGGSADEAGNSVKECSDGGFILAGQTFSYGHDGDAYLLKTNSSGDTAWTKIYVDPLIDEVVAVDANNDGSFTFVVRDSTLTNDIDVRVIKTNSSGGILWNKVFSGTEKDTPKRIRSTSDGGYIVGAISRSFGWINPDMWLLKLDASGDSIWSRHFGGSEHEHCHDVKQTADGGYIATGHSRSYSPGQKIMLLKLNSLGKFELVSLEENSLDELTDIYPNPTDGIVKIDYSGKVPLMLSVSNSLGQILYSENLEAFKNETRIVDLKDNKPGLYFLTLVTENSKAVRKIVLK